MLCGAATAWPHTFDVCGFDKFEHYYYYCYYYYCLGCCRCQQHTGLCIYVTRALKFRGAVRTNVKLTALKTAAEITMICYFHRFIGVVEFSNLQGFVLRVQFLCNACGLRGRLLFCATMLWCAQMSANGVGKDIY